MYCGGRAPVSVIEDRGPGMGLLIPFLKAIMEADPAIHGAAQGPLMTLKL